MHMHLKQKVDYNIEDRNQKKEMAEPQKCYFTSEPLDGVPAADGLGWNETSLPPKPKDTPVGHFNHFGALKHTGKSRVVKPRKRCIQ